MTRTCTKCNKPKREDCFTKRKDTGKYRSWCRECIKDWRTCRGGVHDNPTQKTSVRGGKEKLNEYLKELISKTSI